jgi:hypothetical protein
MGTNPTLFTLTIKDESEDLTVYNGRRSLLPWALLCQFEQNYCVYDWIDFRWKSVSREQYTDFKSKNYYLEITTGINKDFWLEFPMSTGGHPKKVEDSEVKNKTKKKIRREPVNEYFRSSQSESGLKKYIETERLLESLARDDY